MYSEAKINLIKRIDQFIRLKSQGNATDISKRLGISKRTFYRCLDFMKEVLGAPVKFDATSKRYYYTKRGKVFIGFHELETLTKAEEESINGGYFKNIFIRVSKIDTLFYHLY